MNLELEELEESEPRKVSFGVCCPVDNSRTNTLMESAYRPLLCLLRAGYATPVRRKRQQLGEKNGW
jgi:hypothetical protein